MKIETKIISALLIAFVATCLLGGAAYLDATKLLERNTWVVHTYQVLQKIDETFVSLQDMELGSRGYLLTGEELYLDTYAAGQRAFETRVNDLQNLTVDNSVQQINIEHYRHLTADTIAAMQQRINARKSGDNAAVAAFRGLDSKQRFDQVRALTATMQAEENRLLKVRRDASAQSARRTLTTFFALVAVAFLLFLSFYVFIRRDLANRRRVAMALEASDKRFRGVMESAPDAMLISNADGVISLSNTEAERLFGYTRQELAGQTLSSLLMARVNPLADPVNAEQEPARLASEQALADLQARGAQFDGVRRNGERFPVDLSRSPLESEEQQLLITAIRDRTAQQQAEDALRKFSLDLTRSNAELERFAYVASHDLQEPLRMVSSYTQLLSKRYKGKLDANADEFIAYAVDGAARMQKLISDLLMLSRVGTQARPSEPVETKAILLRVLNDLKPLIEAASAEIHYPEDMPVVLADNIQIGQLFQNLLGNGLKFRGEAAPVIEVGAGPDPEDAGLCRFTVQDNGIGIEPQYFERIFVIFQRLHGKEQYAGTGIGLAICKKIVERHGGRLWVESQPAQGTRFIFTLPVVSV